MDAPIRTEAEFDAALHELHDRPLLERAIALGARAERLAWVFEGGYQSAVAACFPEFDAPGLSCFAATTREGAAPCRLERDGDGWHLYGEKTWIAAVDHVARLVVSVDTDEGPVVADVRRGATGLTLTNPKPASFLAELSQGTARFDAVRITPDARLAATGGVRRFRAAEPLYVCAALAARVACSDAMSLARELEGGLDDRASTKAGLEALRASLRATLPHFEQTALPDLPEGLQTSFDTDRRLLKMFVRLD